MRRCESSADEKLALFRRKTSKRLGADRATLIVPSGTKQIGMKRHTCASELKAVQMNKIFIMKREGRCGAKSNNQESGPVGQSEQEEHDVRVAGL